MVKFKSSLRNFYGRFYEWVKSYRISGHRWRRIWSNGRYYYPTLRFSPNITYWIRLIVGFVLTWGTTRQVSHVAACGSGSAYPSRSPAITTPFQPKYYLLNYTYNRVCSYTENNTTSVPCFLMWIRVCLPIKITWDHLQFMAGFALLSLIFCMFVPLCVFVLFLFSQGVVNYFFFFWVRFFFKMKYERRLYKECMWQLKSNALLILIIW